MFNLTAQDFANQLTIGLTGYMTLLVISGIVAIIMVHAIQRRVATFMLMTFGMYTEFLIAFYGINLGIPHFTELENIIGFQGIFALSLIVSLALILFTAFYLRWYLAPYVSEYERDTAGRSEEELSQFDKNRIEYMKRRQELTGRGKGK